MAKQSLYRFRIGSDVDQKRCQAVTQIREAKSVWIIIGKPTLPHVHVRRTWMTTSAKLTSCHCRPRHSEMRTPLLAGVDASHGIPNPQFRLQHYFLWTIFQPVHTVKQQPRGRIA